MINAVPFCEEELPCTESFHQARRVEREGAPPPGRFETTGLQQAFSKFFILLILAHKVNSLKLWLMSLKDSRVDEQSVHNALDSKTSSFQRTQLLTT